MGGGTTMRIGKILYFFTIIKTVMKYYCFSWDKLTMYDGGSITSPMIGEYCDSTPPDIITTSNEIFVHFLTSPYWTDIGFKLMYNPTSNKH